SPARFPQEPGHEPGRRPRPAGGRRRELTRLGVALLAGAFAGTAITGTGVWPGGAPSPVVLAQELPHQVLQAATHLKGYHAQFNVTEWHFQPRLPLRHFTLDVWLAAPERFRMDVVDHTPYP